MDAAGHARLTPTPTDAADDDGGPPRREAIHPACDAIDSARDAIDSGREAIDPARDAIDLARDATDAARDAIDSAHDAGGRGCEIDDAPTNVAGWPSGFIGWGAALRRLGVSRRAMQNWLDDGRFDYAGVLVRVPGAQPRAYRVFDPIELERARQRMIDGAADRQRAKVDRRASRRAAAVLPDGFVDRHAAAARLGVVTDTLKRYVAEGRVPPPRTFDTPGGIKRLGYAIADLDAAKATMDDTRARFALPDGYIGRDGAAAMFGVSEVTWTIWERTGRVPQGEWGRSRTNKPCRIYDIETLSRVLTAMRSADVPYREPGRRGTYVVPDTFARLPEAARMFGVEYATLHRWEREGRLSCGERVNGSGPKVYPIAALQRLIAENGSLRPPYPDPDRPGVWRVPLRSHGMKRREVLIDAADVPIVEGKHLHWAERGNHGPGQVISYDGERQVRLRQMILGVFDGDARIGHINGDPLDCRRDNLMLRSRQHVGRAMPKHKGYAGRPCSSRFKGVCFEKQTGKWRAGIVVDGQTIRLGRFSDELAAAQAYDDAARDHFGDQARPNFPDGMDAWLEQDAAAMPAARQAA